MTGRRVGRAGTTRAICAVFAATALALCAVSGTAQAAPNLVLNGDFSQSSLSPTTSYTSYQLGSWSYNSTNYTGTLTDWSVPSSSYNYVFTSGTATAFGQYNTLTLADGSAIGNSPAGGNFIGADGDYGTGAITQTISGLKVGAPATVSFWWGAAQQSGASGSTTQYWQVSLCPTGGCTAGETADTATVNLANASFSGWMQATMTFIPTSTSEVLSFLAVGTGSPPFVLLDGVSVTNPEPASLAIMLTGLLGLGGMSRLRRRSAQRRRATA
jgi:hypothetical protein